LDPTRGSLIAPNPIADTDQPVLPKILFSMTMTSPAIQTVGFHIS
jgi:hypothetical protein